MRPIGILITGEPIAQTQRTRGGFDALIRDATGPAWPGVWEVIDCRAGLVPAPERFSAAIVTGSPASVTEREPWMLALQEWLRAAIRTDCAVLGICFGHQVLAQALGGRVDRNPMGREMGTVRVQVSKADPVLGAPEGEAFHANMTHQDSVVEVPPGAQLLARTAQDPHAALRVARGAWGVQFHPEFDAEVMGQYVRDRWDSLVSEGLAPERLNVKLSDAASGRAVLRRFVATVTSSMPRSR
jgi:GMP synthase (glutamine-hydrolysing)